MHKNISTKITPKNNHVILFWDKPKESVTDFGLVIPDSKRRGDTAEVIAVSNGSDLKVGDKVLFNKAAGTFFKENLIELLITKESEIYAVIEE